MGPKPDKKKIDKKPSSLERYIQEYKEKLLKKKSVGYRKKKQLKSSREVLKPSGQTQEDFREKIARSIDGNEEDRDYFSYDQYQDRLLTLKATKDYLNKLKQKETLSRKDVLQIRREIMVLNELTDHLLRNNVIEEKIKYKYNNREILASDESEARDMILKEQGITYSLIESGEGVFKFQVTKELKNKKLKEEEIEIKADDFKAAKEKLFKENFKLPLLEEVKDIPVFYSFGCLVDANDKNKYSITVMAESEKEVKAKLKNLGYIVNAETKIVNNGEVKKLYYKVSDNEGIDITQQMRLVNDIENDLRSFKQVDPITKKEKSSVYESLEKRLRTITVTEFLERPLNERLELISNIEDWDKFKSDQLVVFNFAGNKKLERQIGLGDLMSPDVRKISLGGLEYTRKGNQGFYRNGKYLAIWTGTKVTITERKKGYSVEKEYTDTFIAAGKQEEIAETNDVTAEQIKRVSREFLVDAQLLKVLVEVIKHDNNNAVDQGYEFLHMAARYIQNAQMKYEHNNKHKNLDAINKSKKHYTANFIAFALDRFNLFNNYSRFTDAKIRDVIEGYSKLKGISLKFDDIVKKYREDNKPINYNDYRGKSEVWKRNYAKRGGEVVYENPVGGSGVDMVKDLEKWRNDYLNSLIESGLSEEQARMNVFYAEKIYKKFQERMGTLYKSKVRIRSYNGHSWRITNNCVGGGMKAIENLPIHCVRGRQQHKYASQYYWGKYRNGKHDIGWIDSMVRDKSDIIRIERLTPNNCDERIGKHLLPGECAPAGLWNHCLWLYKRFDGTIMICHSGADVRPKRISVNSVSEPPAGYNPKPRNGYYVRLRGSKVNELPFRDFLAKRQGPKGYTVGTWRARVRFVTLRKIVQNNMPQQDFVSYYNNAPSQDKMYT